MRGRAAEIADAAGLDWEVVWEALKTEPPAEDPSTITQELGLDQERSVRVGYERSLPGTEFSGTRHGRAVTLSIGIVPSVRGKATSEVQIGVTVAPFRISAAGGCLVAEPGAMSEVYAVLDDLEPNPKVWRTSSSRAARRDPHEPAGDVTPAGLRLRPLAVERLADRLGA
jgi:hypothetical protein